MKLFILFLFFIPLVSGMELLQGESFVIVKNNLNSIADYNVVGEDYSYGFSLAPNSTRSIDIGNYEISEDLGTNLISSAYIGSRYKKDYTDLKVIIIGVSVLLLVYLVKRLITTARKHF